MTNPKVFRMAVVVPPHSSFFHKIDGVAFTIDNNRSVEKVFQIYEEVPMSSVVSASVGPAGSYPKWEFTSVDEVAEVDADSFTKRHDDFMKGL